MRNVFRAALVAAVMFVSNAVASATDFVIPKQSLVVTDGNYVITPGKFVPVGELVDVSVPKPSDPVPNLQAVSYDWKVLEQGKEKKYKSGQDQSNIWYAAGIKQRTHQVFCVVTYLYIVRATPNDPKSAIVEAATRTQFLYAEINIGGAVPDVDPVVPTPVPAPMFADGKYKLAKSTYDLVMKNDVTAEDRTKAAKALAISFKGMASSIRAGAIKTPKDILEKTVASNQSALKNAGVSRAAWEKTFVQLQEIIYDLYESDKVSTAEDFASAWDEISDGFSGVK